MDVGLIQSKLGHLSVARPMGIGVAGDALPRAVVVRTPPQIIFVPRRVGRARGVVTMSPLLTIAHLCTVAELRVPKDVQQGTNKKSKRGECNVVEYSGEVHSGEVPDSSYS